MLAGEGEGELEGRGYDRSPHHCPGPLSLHRQPGGEGWGWGEGMGVKVGGGREGCVGVG